MVLKQYVSFSALEAWKWAEEKGFKRKSTLQKMEDYPVPSISNANNWVDMCSPIPSLDREWIEIKITEVRLCLLKVFVSPLIS